MKLVKLTTLLCICFLQIVGCQGQKEKNNTVKVEKRQNEKGLWGVVDKEGNTIVPFKYHSLYLVGDYIKATLWDNEKATEVVFSTKGKVVIPAKYNFIEIPYKFSNKKGNIDYFIVGIIDYKSKTSKVGVVNQNNEVVIPIEYYSIDYLYDHQCFVGKSVSEKMYYVLDENGKRLSNIGFDTITRLSNYGDEPVRLISKNDLYGLVELATGKLIFKPQYEWLGLEHYNLSGTPEISTAKKSGKWGVVNLQEEVLVPYKYEHINYEGFDKEGMHLTVVENDTLKKIIYKDRNIVSEKKAENLYTAKFSREMFKEKYPNGVYVPKEFNTMSKVYFGPRKNSINAPVIPAMVIKNRKAEVPFIYFTGAALHIGDIESTYPIKEIDNGFSISMTASSRFAPEKEITNNFKFVKKGNSYFCEECRENRIPVEWIKLEK